MRGYLCRSISPWVLHASWTTGLQKVKFLTWPKFCICLFTVFCRHVEVRTNAPQGYVFTIKVSEDMPPGSVGFSLVQVTYCNPFISGAWSVYECATKQNKKKTVLYIYLKFQYSAHLYFVEKGQCHNDYSVPSQNGNVQ